MSVSKLVLLILLLQFMPRAESAPASDSLPRAASDSASDALILQEIADSLKVKLEKNRTRKVDGRVTYLSLYYQGQRGAVPPALGGLDSLRHIHMGITNVTSLPREIGRLKRMDTIDIGSSQIGPTIPDEIGELSNLRYLKVFGCKLETLPKSLMKLQKLETVDFTRNNICRLDDSLRQWILSNWPMALDNQNTSKCASTEIVLRQTPPSPQANSPIRRLAVPGVPGVLPGQGRDAEDIRYYTPLGRSLWWRESRMPSTLP